MKTQLVPVDPTEKMKKAADDQCFYCDSCKEATANPLMVWVDMLAAAPTPPAQENEPFCPRPINSRPDKTTMAECILAGECGCTVNGTEYGVKKLAEQEAEPVAHRHTSYDGVSWIDANPEYPSVKKSEALYTRPDGLRKAAEELVSFLEQLNPNMGNWLNENAFMRLKHNLRAELNRGEA